MSESITALFAEREPDRFALHSRHLNEQMVRVLKAIGYDVGFCRGKGQYLYDRDGERYLDLLSGFGVFAIGRNHPAMREALKSVLDGEFPNLVQMDVSVLAGILAERCWRMCPTSTRFSSQIPARRRSRRRSSSPVQRPAGRGIVYCEHAFHGLTYGALSLNGDEIFRDGFEPLLPDCVACPVQRSFGAREGALRREMSRPSSSSRSRAKASICRPTTTCSDAAELCRTLRRPVRCRRNSDRAGTHRPFPRGRTLERRTRHGAARQDAVGRTCAGRGCAGATIDFRKGLQSHGPGGGARIDFRQERPRHGGRNRDARRPRVGTADRERGADGRASVASLRAT